MHTLKCPECGSEKLLYHSQRGECHCQECGIVVDDSLIEHEPYINEAVKSHAELPGMSTAGTYHPGGKIVKASWLLTTRQKNFRKAKYKIDIIGSSLKLPEIVIKEAIRIFKCAIDHGLNIGRDNNSLIYASIYAACSIHSIPKTGLELTAYSSMTRAKMLKACSLMKKYLGIKLLPTDPTDLLNRFASRLQLSQATITLATKIIFKLRNTSVVQGRHPETIAATALYIASKLNKEQITQRQITNATGVIEVTIRKRAREMKEELRT